MNDGHISALLENPPVGKYIVNCTIKESNDANEITHWGGINNRLTIVDTSNIEVEEIIAKESETEKGDYEA